MSIGILTMTFVVFSRQLSAAFPALADTLAPFTGIAWPWYVLIGTTITLATGILSSLTHPVPAAAGETQEARP
jgi:hypothetical protein